MNDMIMTKQYFPKVVGNGISLSGTVHSLRLNNIESCTSNHYYYPVFFSVEMTSLLNAKIAQANYCHHLQSRGNVKVELFMDQMKEYRSVLNILLKE